ncbi:MAG TPA: DUF86 domain-containing protein [Candidatus Nanoarchaeia archaeon]|nr:DUF86 domain-containing protein [Candidatus Nanoarchaeia archaeon]
MDKYLQELDDLLPASKASYLNNLMVRRACEKTVESAIEAVIGIISIIVSDKKLGLPQSEDDLINLLENNQIITKTLASKIRQMKGFRNVLVHKYAQIDDVLVYHFLKKELDDFDLFEKEVREYLK